MSPNSSDFWLSYGAKRIPSPKVANGGAFSYWNGNVALDTHWLNRFDAGVALYSNNPEWGLFGQLVLLHDGELASFLPAVAVGARNIGPDTHEERFLIGTDVTVDSLGHQHEITPFYFKGFHTSPTLYAVATKTLAFHSAALSSISLTIGGGDGMFSQDGNIGAEYNSSGTVVKGMFFGARTVSHPTTNTTISLVGENNGFDYNAGVIGGWRGLSLGVYASELEDGTTRSPASLLIYNYQKWNVSFSYSGNFRDVAHGHWLRTQISELEREQRRSCAPRHREARRSRSSACRCGSANCRVATSETRTLSARKSSRNSRRSVRRFSVPTSGSSSCKGRSLSDGLREAREVARASGVAAGGCRV